MLLGFFWKLVGIAGDIDFLSGFAQRWPSVSAFMQSDAGLILLSLGLLIFAINFFKRWLIIASLLMLASTVLAFYAGYLLGQYIPNLETKLHLTYTIKAHNRYVPGTNSLRFTMGLEEFIEYEDKYKIKLMCTNQDNRVSLNNKSRKWFSSDLYNISYDTIIDVPLSKDFFKAMCSSPPPGYMCFTVFVPSNNSIDDGKNLKTAHRPSNGITPYLNCEKIKPRSLQ